MVVAKQKLDFPWWSRKTMPAAATRVNFFDDSGLSADTNLEVPGQLSNTAVAKIFQVHIDLSTEDGSELTPGNMASINALIRGAFLEMKVNQQSLWQCAVGMLLKSTSLITTTVSESVSGQYKLNESIDLQQGQAFQFTLVYEGIDDASELSMLASLWGYLRFNFGNT